MNTKFNVSPRSPGLAAKRSLGIFSSAAALAIAAILASTSAQAATKTFNSGATTLDTAGNWTPSGIPGTGDEALIDTTNAVAGPTLSTAETFGVLIINNTTLTSLSLTGTTNRAITLSGGGGSTAAIAAGGATGDLLLLGTNVSGTVAIGGGSGAGKLGLTLGAAGNFDVVNSAATANITGIVAGNFNLNKTGAGTLLLSGANTFGSATTTFTIGSGTVKLGAATLSLGAAANLVSVTNGATLDLNGQVFATLNALTVNGRYSSTVGALTNSSATAGSYAGTVAMASDTSIGGNNGDMTLSNVISGNFNLTKVGSNTLTISKPTSTFGSGTTTFTIAAGTVKLGAVTTALGVAANSVSVTSGAVLDLNGQIYTTLNPLTINGTGISNGGALINSSNTAGSYAGAVTLGSASTIGSSGTGNSLTLTGGVGGSGDLTLKAAGTQTITLSTGGVNNTGNITNSGSGSGAVTISSAIGSSVTAINQSSATSALTLSGANTNFNGTVALTSGTLKLGSATALGGNGTTTGTGGALSIAAGATLDASVATTVSTVNAENWNGNFTFGGSFALNMGTGAVTLAGGGIQVTNSGASLLTIGVSVSSTGSSDLTIKANAAGGFTFTGGVSNQGAITNSGSGTGVVTISSAIGSNVTAINQSSSGTMTLSGANTSFAGPVNLTAGTLNINSATALGGNGSTSGTGGTLTISAGATLSCTSNTVLSTVNAEVWNGDFTFGGTNTLNVGSGAVSLGSSGASTRTINVTNTSTGQTGGLSIGGIVSNSNGGATPTTLIKSGTGILQLNNSTNSFSNLTVNGGTALFTTAVVTSTSFASPTDLGTPFGTGDTTLNGGGLSLAFGSGSGSLPGYGELKNNIILTAHSASTPAAGQKRNAILSGLISGAGKLTLNLSTAQTGQSNAVFLSHVNNTYSGGTDLNALDTNTATGSQFVANSVNALGGGTGTGGVVTFVNNANVTSQANSYLVLKANQSIAGLSSSTAASHGLGATFVTGFDASTPVTLTINNTSGGTGDGSIYSGAIGGTVPIALGGITATAAAGNNINLVKSGTGAQTLSGASTFTGTTTVSSGTLLVASGGSINTSSGVSVSNSATLNNANGASITPALTLQEGATLISSAASSTFAPTALTFSGDLSDGWAPVTLTNSGGAATLLTQSGALTLSLTGITTGSYTLITGTGGFTGTFGTAHVNTTGLATTDGGATFTGTDGSFNYTFTSATDVLGVAAVPEPSTWALLAATGTFFVAMRRRRRNS